MRHLMKTGTGFRTVSKPLLKKKKNHLAGTCKSNEVSLSVNTDELNVSLCVRLSRLDRIMTDG